MLMTILTTIRSFVFKVSMHTEKVMWTLCRDVSGTDGAFGDNCAVHLFSQTTHAASSDRHLGL